MEFNLHDKAIEILSVESHIKNVKYLKVFSIVQMHEKMLSTIAELWNCIPDTARWTFALSTLREYKLILEKIMEIAIQCKFNKLLCPPYIFC
jgi:hypothetical protein